MHRDLTSNRLLQIRRQGFISRKHVCEIGVAARLRWRHFERVQHRSLGRYVHIGHVSMPHRLTVAEISDRLAVFDDVRDDIQLWVFLVERLAVGIRPRWIELSEVLTEGDELRVRELLAMEDDDEPLAPYVFDRFDVAERATPPSSVMNSRLFIRSTRQRGRARTMASRFRARNRSRRRK